MIIIKIFLVLAILVLGVIASFLNAVGDKEESTKFNSIVKFMCFILLIIAVFF